jgi:hypothetical protein
MRVFEGFGEGAVTLHQEMGGIQWSASGEKRLVRGPFAAGWLSLTYDNL